MKQTKWLVYTVLVALIPIICRLGICLLTKQGTVEMFSTTDFISFGLVLHISNINEVEHLHRDGMTWKTWMNGASVTFIAFYSVLYALAILASSTVSSINTNSTKTCSVILCIVSLLLSFAVNYRASTISEAESNG